MPLYDDTQVDTITSVNADEYNQYATGHNALITSSGQTPTFGTPEQYGKSMAQYSADGDYYIDSGSSSNVYVAVEHNAREPLAELVAGVQIRFIPLVSNTAADPTINISGLGAKTIKDVDGNAIASGDFELDKIATLFYDGTDFRIQVGGSGGGGTELGSIIPFVISTLPQGYLECNGQIINRTTYPELVEYLTGNPTTPATATLPDLRGEFVRGFDNGRGVDTGRLLGTFQDEEFKAHTHTALLLDDSLSSGFNGFVDGDNSFGTFDIGSTGGTETRPRNIALKYGMKAFATTLNAGSVDLVGLAQDVADNTVDIAANTSDIADIGDETVLFSGSAGVSTINLSDNVNNYKNLIFKVGVSSFQSSYNPVLVSEFNLSTSSTADLIRANREGGFLDFYKASNTSVTITTISGSVAMEKVIGIK